MKGIYIDWCWLRFGYERRVTSTGQADEFTETQIWLGIITIKKVS